MSWDLQIIPAREGTVVLDTYGATDSTVIQIIQRLFVLMLTDESTGYRGGGTDVSLAHLLEGANTPTDDALTAITSLSCAEALSRLDEETKDLIQSFTGVGENGAIVCTLVLVDGTAARGVFTNV